MKNASAILARSVTWGSSKQSYLTARLLADPDLVDDCLRAYAYFRWADDTVDLTLQTLEQRVLFIARQKELVRQLYRHVRPLELSPEEDMLADLIVHDRGSDSGLRSFIMNFMAVIEFDAHRRGRTISRHELSVYTNCLGTAVMDGLLYFIGNGRSYPRTPDRNLAVVGAHLTHMLRDTLEDLPAGFINIPQEDLEDHRIDLADPSSPVFRQWVRCQVEQARLYFAEGTKYIDSLDVLRARLAGVWYCARFDCVLTAIERDGFVLRPDYPERHSLSSWLKMLGLAVQVILSFYRQKSHSFFTSVPLRGSFEPRHGITSFWYK